MLPSDFKTAAVHQSSMFVPKLDIINVSTNDCNNNEKAFQLMLS